jgi:integrase/recombinase XerC
MATGFRAGEMRSLSRGSFALDAEPPVVTVQAGYSRKARKTVTQVVPEWLAVKLRAWFAAGGDCWQTLPVSHPGDCLQRDLADSGVRYAVPAPGGDHLLFFDFHALRVWYCTALASQPGISPKTLMTLCRHTDPRLTLGIYAKVRLADLTAATNEIPEPGGARPAKRKAK